MSRAAKPAWQTVASVAHTATQCNITGHRIISPLQHAVWQRHLISHPDQQLVRALLHSIVYGADLCHRSADAAWQSQLAANSSGCKQHADYIRHELDGDARKHHRIGPCAANPFARCKSSPLSVVETVRADGSAKHRLVHNLSWPRRSTLQRRSVNADITQLECKLSCFSDALAMLNRISSTRTSDSKRSPVWLYKIDLRAAYRAVPVRVQDWPLLGCSFNKQLYFDKQLPFGLASSCSIFVAFSDAAEWIIKQHNGIRNIIHYVDDSLGASTTEAAAQREFNAAVATFRELGFEIADEKLVAPATAVEYLGIAIDTESWTISLPHHKLLRIRAMLEEWNASRAACSLRQLQSLCGTLMWASQVIRQGRIFLTRLFAAMAAAEAGNRHMRRTLSADVHKDISWWRQHMQQQQGVSAIPDEEWQQQADISLFTDACGSGFGAVLGANWIHGSWSSDELQQYSNAATGALSMSMLELLALGHAITSFGAAQLLLGRKIWLRCDNSAAVIAIQQGRCRNQQLASIARSLHHVAALYSFEFRISHIAGVDNIDADLLSRDCVSQFQARHRGLAAPQATPLLRLPLQDW